MIVFLFMSFGEVFMGTILLIAIPTVIQAERDVALAQAASSKESNDVNLKITVCRGAVPSSCSR